MTTTHHDNFANLAPKVHTIYRVSSYIYAQGKWCIHRYGDEFNVSARTQIKCGSQRRPLNPSAAVQYKSYPNSSLRWSYFSRFYYSSNACTDAGCMRSNSCTSSLTQIFPPFWPMVKYFWYCMYIQINLGGCPALKSCKWANYDWPIPLLYNYLLF